MPLGILAPAVSVLARRPAPAEPRFEFGENWSRFIEKLDDERIEAARRSLRESLGLSSLKGLSFLDVGSGSGLFSLGASLMGSARVHSIDYDPMSVATTKALKDRFAPGAEWTIEEGDALDAEYMSSLGKWDIVYSWGVLHHTGDMWRAFSLTADRVHAPGRLVVSIYNDQGFKTRLWRTVKLVYNHVPPALRVPYVVLASLPIEMRVLLRHLVFGNPGEYVKLWKSDSGKERGMNRWHDLVDWVGGYPFEVATPQQVFEFCSARGFELRRLRTVGGSSGCNEFRFEHASEAEGS